MFIYLYWESMSRGGAEREGEKEFQAGSTLSTGSQLGAWSHGHEIVTWAEIKSLMLNGLSPPGDP